MNEIMYKMTVLSETKSEKPDNQRVETPFFFLLCEKPMRQGFLLIIFEGGSRKEIERDLCLVLCCFQKQHDVLFI